MQTSFSTLHNNIMTFMQLIYMINSLKQCHLAKFYYLPGSCSNMIPMTVDRVPACTTGHWRGSPSPAWTLQNPSCYRAVASCIWQERCETRLISLQGSKVPLTFFRVHRIPSCSPQRGGRHRGVTPMQRPRGRASHQWILQAQRQITHSVMASSGVLLSRGRPKCKFKLNKLELYLCFVLL